MIIKLEFTEEQVAEIAKQVVGLLRAGLPDVYTVREAAKMLRIDPKTIRRRIDAGLIPTVPNIGATRIPALFIEELIRRK